MGGGAAGGAAVAAAIQAVKASGAIVRVDPEDFTSIVGRQDQPLVVVSEWHFLGTSYQYLTSYKGLAFHTKTKEPLGLPGRCEVIRARKMWMPS
jgi:hypothetical protein